MPDNWNVTVVSSTPDEAVHGQDVEGPVGHDIRHSIGSPSSPTHLPPSFPIIPSAPPLPPQPPVMPPQVPVYFIRPPSPPAQERDIEPELTPEVIAKAQKHARFAISALDYEDVEQSRKELRTALAILGGR
jgi:vacuolar protein sorting-associated protein VTA1